MKTNPIPGYALLIAASLISCAGNGSGKPAEANAAGTTRLIASVTPTYGTTTRQGETVRIAWQPEAQAAPDSVILSVRGRRIASVDSTGHAYALSENHPTGRIVYTLTAYSGESHESRNGEFTVLAARAPVLYQYAVRTVCPHDRKAYTQGLLWHDGFLYESTGILGESSLRRVDLPSGNVLQRVDLPAEYFGEGLALLGDRLYQLTWENNKALVYDRNTFEKLAEFNYAGEGWGLATDGTWLYMSDGTERIRVLDPETFRAVRTLDVYTDQRKIVYINEMEWIEGELWANVYTTDQIVRIDPQTGAVTGVIDLSGLLPQADLSAETDVLNGIAYDARRKRIFVTGKYWNKLFEIEIIRK